MHLSARNVCCFKNVNVGHFKIFCMWAQGSKMTGGGRCDDVGSE